MRIHNRLVGLLATLLLLGILIGLPATLLALGASPIPRSLPTLEQIRSAFTTPDDGTLALGAIKVIAWTAWIVLAATILLEVGARIRGLRAPRIPGLSLPQGAARQLVSAALLLFIIAAPTAAPTAAAAPAPTATSGAATTTAAPAVARPIAADPVAGTYTVQRGDSLSRIAQRELGDANRWHELVSLNPHIGAHPDLIYTGTVLTLPDVPSAPQSAHTYTVKAGDTLSGIAEAELGDANRYPEIFQASRRTLQPGGIRLVDPDVIDVGQTLTIPGAHEPEAVTTPPPVPQSAPPTPHRTTPSHRPDVGEVTPAAPALVPSGAAQSTPQAQEVVDATDRAMQAPWMVAGLTGGGALLAGSLLLLLRRRRRTQFRHRRPGRTLVSPAPVLGPVEKTITVVGGQSAPTVEHLDAVLRRLAARAASTGQDMPVLAAVELTATHLVLHLAEPTQLPAPWEGNDDQSHWQVSPRTPLDEVGPLVSDQPAPYPLLVTIGLGDHDEVWLLNIEDLAVTVTGDPLYGQDWVRYVAAEIATNPWSAGVQVACLGVATELAPLNPDRIHVYEAENDLNPIKELLADAVATVDRSDEISADVSTARAHQAGADAWPARVLLVDADHDDPTLTQLLDLVHTTAGRTATSVVVAGHRAHTPATAIEVTADGRLTLLAAGLNLVAVGLTHDEALGCAALLAHSEDLSQIPVPVNEQDTEGWRSYSDAAGALRTEHTLPRNEDIRGEDTAAASLLDDADDAYLASAATTPEDLQVLAPRVRESVRQQVESADPTLDDDLAMWNHPDSALPKLRLLGPVRATTRGKPLTKRRPYMTELLAFIALRRLGATPDEVAEAFNIGKPKARDYVLTIRQWLGTNPRTGTHHLPDARLAPASAIRDVPVYQVVDLLIDADLFRRLRVRGQARGGAEGIEDLRKALTLVEGRPFDYPIEREQGGGWAWLLEGDRLDEHLTVAIVDVAHIVTTHALTTGDLPTARMAAETATLAAPHEEIPRLDLAAVAAAEGHHAEAHRIIRDDVCNRTDDEGPPPELPPRTEQILRTRQGWTTTKAS